MMKIKKKALVVTGIVVVAAVAIVASAMAAGNRAVMAAESGIRVVTLEKSDLRSTVSSTGTIYSANSVSVYSRLSYSVKSINVAVGDRVEAGDVLLELDSTGLEANIAQSKARLNVSQANAYQSLTSAQKNLEAYQNGLKNDRDNALLRAEQVVKDAEDAVASAKLGIESANVDVSVATRNFREAYDNDDDIYSDADIRNMRSNLTKAEISLQRAENTYEQSKTGLENARISLEIAKTDSSESIRSLQEKVQSAQLGSNSQADLIAIAELERDLSDCIITAPVSGTITAVNAKEGAGGSGLLFVIQDTNELKVLTNIKEYDITTVQLSDKVIIRTDATGEEEFVGELTRIAPTSTLTTAGDKTNSTDAEFEAEIIVKTKASPLRIGMNARLSIVTEEKTGVFAVPFEALDYIDGESCVYVQETGADSSVTYRKIVVEPGLETNIYIEISSSELTEGMQIVRSISDLTPAMLGQEEVSGR